MSVHPIVVSGRITPEGALVLSQPVNLPPGEVQVTIAPAEEPRQAKATVWEVLDRIWADQAARGYVGRSREAIDAQVHDMREESEEEMRDVEQAYADWRTRRDQNGPRAEQAQ